MTYWAIVTRLYCEMALFYLWKFLGGAKYPATLITARQDEGNFPVLVLGGSVKPRTVCGDGGIWQTLLLTSSQYLLSLHCSVDPHTYKASPNSSAWHALRDLACLSMPHFHLLQFHSRSQLSLARLGAPQWSQDPCLTHLCVTSNKGAGPSTKCLMKLLKPLLSRLL